MYLKYKYSTNKRKALNTVEADDNMNVQVYSSDLFNKFTKVENMTKKIYSN